ncbi:response regulator [Luteolibacter sp. GHJ8]|uniref:histidine kinase n=1 Tax=Luteolibacter rhizosphaerae TaxID=2989719 RepID=A0ABT3FX51_9BACT|nr:response regulator [Luteolibacter rhizosphaerae]MCW1912138.1 response regulator [Luteolibacter rhizosphaerae]
MPNSLRPSPLPSQKAGSKVPIYIGFAAAVAFFLFSGYNAYRNTNALRKAQEQVQQTHTVITSFDTVASLLKDAETGQRGFVITGDERYLQPYYATLTAIQGEVEKMRGLTDGNVLQRDLFHQVEAQIAAKLEEMDETIRLRRDNGFEAARALVVTDRGKEAMDQLRENLAAMRREENRQRTTLIEQMEGAHSIAVSSGFVTAGLGIGLALAVLGLLQRAQTLRQKADWMQVGKLELGSVMSGERTLGALGESVLAFLSNYVDAHAGALFVRRGDYFDRVALTGVTASSEIPEQFKTGEGLLGRAVAEKAARRLDDVPDGYLRIGSGLGEGVPRNLIVLPAATDNLVNAVIELGFIHPLTPQKQEFLQQSSEQIALAVKAALYREHLQELLEETQQQSEEVQAQAEELRVSNEELEEQSHALRETQSRLELQQAELEQVNFQLSEQASTLEGQRNDLIKAKQSLESQARLVEQASRYKSDFLANMSHELRTPLNSSLILARILADNRPGNLNEEQIKYAQTIETAGNDLLNLINDVLDLSKIEAGHMEIHAEPVKPASLIETLKAIFEPIAAQKGVALHMTLDPQVPAEIETDTQRLMQVLKNLLSNAVKFTERGEVSCRITPAGPKKIRISVQDTGIGIDPEFQRSVFEPFYQADAASNRKFGGTGLGLSISRQLAWLLGGEIELQSEPGKGSTFTLTLPCIHVAPAHPMPLSNTPALPAAPVTAEIRQPATAAPTPKPVDPAKPRVIDDREQLSGSKRVILIVEDDEAFARILLDLAHEMHFHGLIATTAEEALALAPQHLPGAVILDVGLPDNSGLFVLERLKADSRTRHIPVHVVSGSDYTQTALALGAVGYMLKPVKREQLVDAFQKLEGRLNEKMRKVLVVEDDPVQLDAMKQLFGTLDVETSCAGTAAGCLALLKDGTFDCMVLDLSLPDASGFSLLETLSKEDSYSFPPVIVYTGRELAADEEQRLRRYSKSIIIKGAKSPERLLDEVTLFLHQVVSELPPEQQRMLEKSGNRDAALEGRRILIAEDDVRNVFALTSLLEGRGVKLQIARNGREAVTALERSLAEPGAAVDLVLMDIMMPEMDGITAMREIRKRPEWKKLPIIALTAKAMKNDQEACLAAGANDYLAKPLDVDKLLSLIRVWMPR